MLVQKVSIGWFLARSYVRGWRSRRRIVVLESDDWGAIRTSSRQAYDQLVAAGFPMDRSPYSLDALETSEDLVMLFEVLEGVRDCDGRPACVTANMVMANPDFERIREGGFREYYWRPVGAALADDPRRRQVARLWEEGRRRGLFVPQLHAREHVRWWEWLAAVRRGVPGARETFDLGMCGVPLAVKADLAFYSPPYLSEEQLAEEGVDLEVVVREGAELFGSHFGYRSVSAIAPNCCWTDQVEAVWWQAGIRYIQGKFLQVYPAGREVIRRPHYLGEHSPSGCVYLIRNCSFEPLAESAGCVERCLRQVAWAFRFGKPAVICSHRANYVGSISPDNRSRGLGLLADLLGGILRRWPDVRFMSTPELGDLIEGGAASTGQPGLGRSAETERQRSDGSCPE